MANQSHFELLKQGAENWNEWYSSNPQVIADLAGLCLAGLDLRGIVLTGANLSGSDLRSADLTGADLRGALLNDAVLTGATLDGADLRFACGLTPLALAGTSGSTTTRLPDRIGRPDSWLRRASLMFENPGLVTALLSGHPAAGE